MAEMEVQGAPEGATATLIQGAPPGAVATPVGGDVQGVPEGAVGTPIEGVPANAVSTPINATPPQSDPSLLQQFWAARPHPIEEAKGVIKGAGQTVAGLLDMYANAPGAILPGIVPGTEEAARKAADAIKQRSVVHNFSQEQGSIAEAVMELMAAPELVPESGAAALSSHLGQASKLAKVLETYPTIRAAVNTALAVTKGATRAGIEQGVQTGLKTEDPDAALNAAAVGAATGGVLSGVGSGVSEGMNLLRPTAETLEGVEVPVGASQRPNASVVAEHMAPAEDVAGLQEARNAAAPQIIQNGARRAALNVLRDVNETRGAMQGPAEEAGIQPGTFKFTVAPHGEPVETTDPNFVQKLLNEARDLQESDAFNELGPRQQTRVTRTVDDLSNQLDQYHQERATRPRFTPVDIQSALQHVEDYRTAGDIVQNSVDDVYQRMRGAANEQLDKKWLKQLSPDEFQQLMEQNSERFTPADRQIATDTFRKGVALKAYHEAIQQGWNISPAQAEATADIGGQRIFTGSNRISNEIDDVLAKYGSDLRSMVGEQGIRSIRRLNQLAKDPDTAQGFAKVLRATSAIMRHHYGGIAGFMGHLAAPFLGVSHITGITGGAAAGYALKKVVNRIATNPAIADRVAYAVQHKISSRVAAPLIASMIVRASEPGPLNPRITPQLTANPYVTHLTREEEKQFQSWVKDNNIPFDPSPTSDYDMRGYFKDNVLGKGGVKPKISSFDNRPHFPDTYKTPYHKTFSNESKYATPDAPHWVGDRLIDKNGRVIADETPAKGK